MGTVMSPFCCVLPWAVVLSGCCRILPCDVSMLSIAVVFFECWRLLSWLLLPWQCHRMPCNCLHPQLLHSLTQLLLLAAAVLSRVLSCVLS